MQRYNSFNLIHKALRSMLYDTALTLQQTYFADIDETENVLEKIEAVLFVFEQHAHHEDAFILPAVYPYEPALVDEFEKEHATDISLANKLKNLLNIYRYSNFTEERINAGSAICKSFTDFMIFNLEHMGKEEIMINQALWKHYTDEQILEINKKLVATIPADEVAATSKWMLRSINEAEAIAWFKNIKKDAPAFVLQSLLDMAENELQAERFRKIQEGVMDEYVLV